MNRSLPLLSALVLTAILLGLVASQYPSKLLILSVIGLGLFTAAFLNHELALYILIFSMLLSPEFIVGHTTGEVALSRGVTLRLDDFLLMIIGGSWFLRTAIRKDLGLFLRTPLNKPILYYIVACMVSTGLGIIFGRVNALTGFFFVLKYFEYFLVYFMVVNHLETREQLNRLLIFLFLTCFVVCLYGILQIPSGGRVSAPFEGVAGEPNTFGGYLIIMGAVAIGLLIKTDNILARRLLFLLIATMIMPFLFTQSRASYLAVLPVLITLVVLSDRRLHLLIILLLGLIVTPFLIPSPVKERILFTFTQKAQSGQIEIAGFKLDTSTTARVRSWKRAIRDLPQHPFLGFGITGYKFMDAQYPRVLVETGLLGFLAFAYLIYSVFQMAKNNLGQIQMPGNRGLVIGFIAGYIGLLFHSIGANTFIIVRIMEPFWLLAGIVAVLPALELRDGSSCDIHDRA